MASIFAPAGQLTVELWAQVGVFANSMDDLWSLTASCRSTHAARDDPTLLCGWLVRRKGADLALLSLITSKKHNPHMARMVEHALRLGADPNARISTMFGTTTPLIAAARLGCIDVVRALLAGGANANAVTLNGATALSALTAAAIKGHTDVVQALLAGGADANGPGARLWGDTALSAAASQGRTAVVKALLAGGAKVNAVGPDGFTALITAAGWGHADVVQALLDAGADPNAEGPSGLTALRAAAHQGHSAVVQALLDAGADAIGVYYDGV